MTIYVNCLNGKVYDEFRKVWTIYIEGDGSIQIYLTGCEDNPICYMWNEYVDIGIPKTGAKRRSLYVGRN